jgi:small conductance mechanosensitive channel
MNPQKPLIWIWPDTAITILIIIAAAICLHVVVVFLINRVTARMKRMSVQPEGTLARKAVLALGTVSGVRSGRGVAHVLAIARLTKSIWTITVVIVCALMIMSTIGISPTPVLTTAGIGAVILGFGGQSLIKDYLSGISMIIEDQYGVGDQVTVGDVTGTVEDVTLRITKLRDTSGMVWYLRNGEILRVGNISQGFSTGLIDVPVAYDADVARVTEILSSVLDQVAQDPQMADKLLEPPELLGVDSITATTLTMRIRIKTGPNQQYDLVRAIRELAIAALTAAGIPGPAVIPGTVAHDRGSQAAGQ